MSYTPSATANRTPPQKDNRNTVYAILIGIIACLTGYIIYDKVQDNKVATNLSNTQKALVTKEVDYNNLDSAKNILQAQFDEASNKIDTLTTTNLQLNSALVARNSEIEKKKAEIKAILSNSKASKAELQSAQTKIAELNLQIETYVAEITKLKIENQELTVAKNQLTEDKNKLTEDKGKLEADKKNLENTVDVASTLNASHINITAIKMRGDKEKETETAKRADFFRLSFVIDENRVAASGKKSIYIIVTTPDGKVSATQGSFTTRDGAELQYTENIDVNYEQGKVLPVSFDWKPGTEFMPGDYKIAIYNNGFKIGEATKTMKKGGLFS